MLLPSFARTPISSLLLLASLDAGGGALAQAPPAGDPSQGKIIFQQSCAICHADSSGPGNAEMVRQGPSLVGVVGRHAAASSNFNYTKAMSDSGLTWDSTTLDRFLTNPAAAVPGTTMPISVPSAQNRLDLIAYLSTLKPASSTAPPPTPAASAHSDAGDWHHAAPGMSHHLTLADLPPPYATTSSGNGPRVVPQPAGAALSVPPGFKVQLFAAGFSNPRIIRVAPNGDIFLAETAANRIRILRTADGAETPLLNQIFAAGLDRPFGIAFYPPGKDPQWIYVANNNSVVRFAYHNGDLQAGGTAQVIVP